MLFLGPAPVRLLMRLQSDVHGAAFLSTQMVLCSLCLQLRNALYLASPAHGLLRGPPRLQ